MKKLILSAALLSISALTFAQDDTGFYVGASAGYARFDNDTIDDINGFSGIDMDDKSTGYKLTAGYSINHMVSVEAFYIDSLSLDLKGSFNGVSVHGDVDTKGYGLAAVFKAPLFDNATVYSKLGAAKIKSDFDFTASVNGNTASVTADGNETNALIGIGAEYRFNNALSAKAEYEVFAKSGDQIHFISAGLAYNF